MHLLRPLNQARPPHLPLLLVSPPVALLTRPCPSLLAGPSGLQKSLVQTPPNISPFLLSLNAIWIIISLLFLLRSIHFFKSKFILKGNFLFLP